MRYREMLRAAKAAGVCQEALDALKKYTSIAGVMTDPRTPEWAYWYTRYVIKGRWPEAEAVIMTSPEWAYWYAHNIIKDRWPDAEPVIATDPRWAYYYACYMIKGRWPEAEAVIATDPRWSSWYDQLIKGGTP